MVYCGAFYCNANSRVNKITCSWLKLPTEPTLSRRSTAGFALFEKTCFVSRSGSEKVAAMGYSGAKFSWIEDDVPTLFQVVKVC